MKLSQTGLELIKSFEGLRLKAYKPLETEKYYTIGYGHFGKDVQENQKITKEEAETILKKDIQKFEDAVNLLVENEINQNQFDALVSFAFNLGKSGLKNSTLLELVNQGKFKEASKEFELFVHAGGKRLEGLVRRRKAEKALFTKTIPTTVKHVIHDIQLGDKLSVIAKKYKTSVHEIMKLNPSIKNEHLIIAGRSIKIPKK